MQRTSIELSSRRRPKSDTLNLMSNLTRIIPAHGGAHFKNMDPKKNPEPRSKDLAMLMRGVLKPAGAM